MNENNGGTYTEFRKLLRRGIGSRSQKDFAKQAGMSQTYLNRMLKSEIIPDPSITTLEKIARVTDLTMNELRIACGYEPEIIENKVLEWESCIKRGLEEYGSSLCDSPADLMDALEMLYFPSGDSTTSIEDEEDNDKKEESSHGADFKCRVTITWGDSECKAYTRFYLYYVRTTKGKILVLGSSLSKEESADEIWVEKNSGYKEYRYTLLVKKCQHTELVKFKSPEDRENALRENQACKRLLHTILDGGNEEFITTRIGFGFYYKKTPKEFKNFLMNHTTSFCTDKYCSELYREAIAEDADPDLVFEGFSFEDYETGYGTGAVIAKILQVETKQDFAYYAFEMDDDEAEDDSCIMFQSSKCGFTTFPKEYGLQLYSYAKELQLPTYGICYHRSRVQKKDSFLFATGERYVKF